MHEFSIALEIGKVIDETLSSDELSHLKRVELIVGKLSGVIEEALILALDAVLTSEYNVENVNINIEVEEAHFECRNCGESGKIEPPLYICPYCGSTDGEISGSSSILVKSLEVEDG